MESLESTLSDYLKRLKVLEEAFVHKADPVFTIKAGFRDAGLNIFEYGNILPSPLIQLPSFKESGIKIVEPKVDSSSRPISNNAHAFHDKGKQ